ncbi:MAG: hypothetical protein V1847_05255 [Candidatus Diapherotrites archaeon]
MPNLTLAIDKETKQKMKQHPSIRWSQVVRSIIEKKLEDFEEAERLAQKSKLTMADFEEISQKIDKASARHALRLLHESNR